MESAIKTIVEVYIKAAKNKESLGDKEFQNLVKSKLSTVMTDTDSSAAIKEMGQGLDENQDGKVGFPEYMNLVGYVANSMSEMYSNRKNEAPADGGEGGQKEEEEEDS